MSKESIVFFSGCAAFGVLAFFLIVSGINRMVYLENDTKAIARIYMPGGCEIPKDVITTDPNKTVFKCNRTYHVLNVRN